MNEHNSTHAMVERTTFNREISQLSRSDTGSYSAHGTISGDLCGDIEPENNEVVTSEDYILVKPFRSISLSEYISRDDRLYDLSQQHLHWNKHSWPNVHVHGTRIYGFFSHFSANSGEVYNRRSESNMPQAPQFLFPGSRQNNRTESLCAEANSSVTHSVASSTILHNRRPSHGRDGSDFVGIGTSFDESAYTDYVSGQSRNGDAQLLQWPEIIVSSPTELSFE